MSAAVAKNAHLWERHPEDWYVEPEWCSRRLFEVEPFSGTVFDPACGLGRILAAASGVGLATVGSDIVRRSEWADGLGDFLRVDQREFEVDNIVSNPPFGIADAFAEHALDLARKVVLLLPTKWMNSASRGAWLETTPLARVWLLSPRPSMPPGPVIEAGERPGNGTVDFAWFVWERGYVGAPELRFLGRDAAAAPLRAVSGGRS